MCKPNLQIRDAGQRSFELIGQRQQREDNSILLRMAQLPEVDITRHIHVESNRRVSASTIIIATQSEVPTISYRVSSYKVDRVDQCKHEF